ncbi:hypothetical protein PRIC2_004280 [Phytophthora ramorum]
MAPGEYGTCVPSRTVSAIRVTKRKRGTEASMQRQVAQKLQLCADTSDSFASIQRSLQRQFLRYKAQQSRAHELGRLQAAFEQTTQFQTFLGAQLHGEEQWGQQDMGIRKRTDRLVRKVANKKMPVVQRTLKIVKKLPRLMKKATSIVSERRRLIKEQEELPTSHQWVPAILWRVYDDVVEASKQEDEVKPLKSAMHMVMKTLKEKNPFFYLQVLYQPPPAHLDGQWEIHASDKLKSIAESMDPFFRDLKRRSFALKNKRDPHVKIHYGWNHLRVTLAFARRAMRHFHFLILHLYAVAMDCESPNVHAGIISEKASSGIIRADAELRSRLGLSREAAVSEDNLIKETYEWTPELLVYLEEWKRCRNSGRTVFGFTHYERERDFLPQFSPRHTSRKHGRRIPRFDVLADISYHLRDVNRAWRASKLGTPGFKSMRIEDIGALETKIKGSLATVVDLIYKMMLARWMDRKNRSDAWWDSVEFREGILFEEESLAETTEDSQVKVVDDSTSDTMASNDDLQDVTDAESVEHKDVQRTKMFLPTGGGFRGPTSVTLREVVDSALAAKAAYVAEYSPPSQTVPRLRVMDHTVTLRDIYAWTDEEIDAFVCKTKRVAEVRAAMLRLHKRLEWSKVSRETSIDTDTTSSFGEHIRDDWRLSCIAAHLCTLTNKAVAFAEETAMHDAAKALIKRPSLRVTPIPAENSNNKPDSLPAPEDDLVKELQEGVLKAHQDIAGIFDSYDGEHTAKWRDFIHSTGRTTAQLLRSISQDDVLHELAVSVRKRS